MSRTYRNRQARRIGAAFRRCRLIAAAVRLFGHAARELDRQAEAATRRESDREREANSARGVW